MLMVNILSTCLGSLNTICFSVTNWLRRITVVNSNLTQLKRELIQTFQFLGCIGQTDDRTTMQTNCLGQNLKQAGVSNLYDEPG